VLVLVYGVTFSYFSVLKHNVFRSFAWDAGIFDQSLYTTIFSGRFLYYTAELYMVPSGCYFASHFSPILLLIAPFYAVYASTETLLVLQTFALAAAAFPLYLMSKTALDNKKAAVIIVALYLLYPPLQAANWFDFHTQAFLPLLLFSTFYLFQAKRWKLYFLSVILALSVEEHTAIVVFLMGLYFLAISKPRTMIESIKSRVVNQSFVPVVTLVISLLWFFLAESVKNSFYINPQFRTRYEATSAFGSFGISSNPLFLPFYIFLKPQNAWNALVYDYPVKLLFLIILFGPLLLVPLKSKFSLISIVLLVPSLLSDYLAYHTIGAQYPLFLVPLIFIAFVIALKKFQIGSSVLSLLKIALIASLLLSISLSPISPLSGSFAKRGLVWYPSVPSPSSDTESLHRLIDLIPTTASLLTQNHIFPHLSARLDAYVIPPIEPFENETNYLDGLIKRSDYVLLDLWAWDTGTAIVFNEITKNNTYGVYGLGSKSLLFKRDYQGTPYFGYYMENRFFQPYEDLFVNNGNPMMDPSLTNATVVLSPKGPGGLVTYGPYNYLLSGEYNITFSVKTGEHDDGYIGTLVVLDDVDDILSRKDIYGFEIKSDVWANFTLPIGSTTLKRMVQFEVLSGGATEVYVSGVYLQRTSETARSVFGPMTFSRNDLLLDSRYQMDNGLLVHFKNLTSDFFWWGPYVSLPQNNYSVTYFLKFSPFPSSSAGTLLSLDVAADGGRSILARFDVRPADLYNSTNSISIWQKIVLNFSARTSLEKVEFRGMNPSSDYDISLAFILLEKAS
jgi:uncharacterized membrane protein